MLESSPATAASFVPSLLELILCQLLFFGVPVHSVHDRPESVDVQMPPLSTTAASFTPSLHDVISCQFSNVAVLRTDLSVHDRPESQDVQMLPP